MTIARYLVPYIAVVVSLIAIAQGLAVKGDQEVIEESLRAGCERGNALRTTLQEQVQRDITRTRNTDPSLFPDIPRERFRELIRASIEAQRRAYEEFAPVDCEDVYP